MNEEIVEMRDVRVVVVASMCEERDFNDDGRGDSSDNRERAWEADGLEVEVIDVSVGRGTSISSINRESSILSSLSWMIATS